jgi:intracellular sulfur oxidation DsrE/DsrF family protein
MKKTVKLLFILPALFFIKPVAAQTFAGAEASQPHYKALYYLDDADPDKIKLTLKNIDNALEDTRLKGKLEVELVAFGKGYTVYLKTNPYEEALLALQKKGVILAECSNTIRAMNIDKSTLFPFISYVPSANGEIIIRSADGWVVVHP